MGIEKKWGVVFSGDGQSRKIAIFLSLLSYLISLILSYLPYLISYLLSYLLILSVISHISVQSDHVYLMMG